MSVMKKVNRGWLLTISHNTRSRELYRRLSSGILKQTEERTFSCNVSFICATFWSTLWRPEIQLSGKQLDKLMKERSVESCSIQWHHCRLPVRQSPCHCLPEAGSLNQEKFHSVISVLFFFPPKRLLLGSEAEWMAMWIFGLCCYSHFYNPVFSKASHHEFAHLLNKGPRTYSLISATQSNHSTVDIGGVWRVFLPCPSSQDVSGSSLQRRSC